MVRASVSGEGKVLVEGVKVQMMWEGMRGRRLSKVSPIYDTVYYYQSNVFTNVFTGVVMLYE